MIKGIGTDLIELKRIEDQLLKSERLVDRVLTDHERTIFDALQSTQRKVEYLGGRFAAKEAFSKAAGTGIGQKFSFKDIEVLNNEQGAPVLTLKKDYQDIVFVSITHTSAYASAFVVIEDHT
ncbi:holo-ACP synthase [Lentibacillus saliphilus]|uniref:holo-ACP synthase n=1 Tax=Lentibacillus saliphilus TaxID=2737028 RepID=UPI001C304D7C|nr:holo-ACP synthase [Lentibacillus saliphilus]